MCNTSSVSESCDTDSETYSEIIQKIGSHLPPFLFQICKKNRKIFCKHDATTDEIRLEMQHQQHTQYIHNQFNILRDEFFIDLFTFTYVTKKTFPPNNTSSITLASHVVTCNASFTVFTAYPSTLYTVSSDGAFFQSK